MSVASEYLLYNTLANMGLDPVKIAIAVNVLLGPTPSDADATDTVDFPVATTAEDFDPATWPAWTSQERWTLGEPEPFVPLDDDADWLERLSATEAEFYRARLDDQAAAQWSARHLGGHVDDRDIITLQGGAG